MKILSWFDPFFENGSWTNEIKLVPSDRTRQTELTMCFKGQEMLKNIFQDVSRYKRVACDSDNNITINIIFWILKG